MASVAIGTRGCYFFYTISLPRSIKQQQRKWKFLEIRPRHFLPLSPESQADRIEAVPRALALS